MDAAIESCPAELPNSGDAGCTQPFAVRCSYVAETCPCDYDDLYWHCSCTDHLVWSCSREYDCYNRCGDAGVP